MSQSPNEIKELKESSKDVPAIEQSVDSKKEVTDNNTTEDNVPDSMFTESDEDSAVKTPSTENSLEELLDDQNGITMDPKVENDPAYSGYHPCRGHWDWNVGRDVDEKKHCENCDCYDLESDSEDKLSPKVVTEKEHTLDDSA